jgi:hypothetical protein
MIGQFRLPDPPPSLRGRILSAAPRGARRLSPLAGLAAAAVLLAGVLWVVLTVPVPGAGRPAQEPDAEIRYSVTTSENGNLYTLTLPEFRRGKERLGKMSMGSVSGRWAGMITGDTHKAFTVPELPTADSDPVPVPEERTVIESGSLLYFRGRPGKDGKIDADIRIYVVEKRAQVFAFSESVSLKPGEERVVKLPK